jgi:hypothetical protein
MHSTTHNLEQNRQLHLFDNSPTRFQELVSLLLQHANSDPPNPRYQFYRMKDRILRRHGSLQNDVDWQDVSKVCWSCDGTGGLYEPGGCHKCLGSGVYMPIYVPLARWKLAGRVFHIPGQSRGTRPPKIAIKGYIQHQESPWAFWAAIALAVIFDRPLLKELLLQVRPFSTISRSVDRFWNGVTWRCPHCGRGRLRGADRGRWSATGKCCDSCPPLEVPF